MKRVDWFFLTLFALYSALIGFFIPIYFVAAMLPLVISLSPIASIFLCGFLEAVNLVLWILALIADYHKMKYLRELKEKYKNV